MPAVRGSADADLQAGPYEPELDQANELLLQERIKTKELRARVNELESRVKELEELNARQRAEWDHDLGRAAVELERANKDYELARQRIEQLEATVKGVDSAEKYANVMSQYAAIIEKVAAISEKVAGLKITQRDHASHLQGFYDKFKKYEERAQHKRKRDDSTDKASATETE